jgi:DNA-binding beta-propeller fold protein YncE
MRYFFALLLASASLTAARADKLVLVAGGGEGPDGSSAAAAKLIQPFGVDFAADGTIYFVEMAKGERFRAITNEGKVITLGGTVGTVGNTGDGGPAAKALFNGMHSLAMAHDGTVFLADTLNNRVRKYDPKTGSVLKFAGTGEKGFSGDGGPAEQAKFGGCYCLCVDPANKFLVITDLDNHRIRKVALDSGTVSTIAGTGAAGKPKDGEQATTQPLVDPRAAVVDKEGNLYILERSGNALRVVDSQGKIRTVVGSGKKGMSSGKALEAAMNGPKHLCIDQDGTVLIADTENHRIVRYSPKEETLTAVAGTGKKGTAGLDGDPLKAELSQPHGVAVHPKSGDIYIADSSNGRVLKIVRK